MREINHIKVIGTDHGFGNVKTAGSCFRSGVTLCEKEPTFKSNLLVYEGRYYLIGESHKEFTADKMRDEDYYILTLAALGAELHANNLTTAQVYIAAGLPLTWVSEQKERFREYLTRNETVSFSFRGTEYNVTIVGASVFPQGFAAIADKLREFRNANMLCDIGNGTMNMMFICDGKPDPNRCWTEKYGVQQCVLAVREAVLRKFGTALDESIIEDVLRNGKADLSQRYLELVQQTAREYVGGIMRRLREHEYDPETVRLYIVGGGGCLVRHFGEYDDQRVTIDPDIC
ncbi:MAG: ParM/StbA family protein, partial [Abditibacteriota bacterium]|nr:ParM/StbA family protein [Abditibacteriota bacterium]